ncbi:MAG: UDP-3-O-(3-hydroxymyristoyl)glucosamine N-acyltransferase [Alphaproteobacteria bacterium]|nr:UDP-3-O-(3-hydroxymyristoyl)glucosamine N-acyltransferase [Alphaproteobacteria bacterium]
MADSRFFSKLSPLSVRALAEKLGLEIQAPSGVDPVLKDVASLDQAGQGHLSFLDNPKYRDMFRQTKATACIIDPRMKDIAPEGVILLFSTQPYKSYALAAQIFYPDVFPAAQIASTAVIHPSADIAPGCVIDDHVVIGAHAVIGKGTWIEPGAVIGAGVVVGEKCRIGAQASVSHTVMGSAVRLYPGVRVGQDGFGFAMGAGGHVKVPQLGRVIIEDHVEIGANTCIDRGSGPDTVIGAGTIIDNLVQIAHNVKIGKGCVLVAQCGIAGSTVLGDYAVMAAQSGVAGHLTVGVGARVGAQAGVIRDMEPGETLMGMPGTPIKEFWRQMATLKRLTKRQKSE